MTPEPGYVKFIKILAIYIFPLIIVGLLSVIAFVPAGKKSSSPQTAQEIDAQIQALQKQKAGLSGS